MNETTQVGYFEITTMEFRKVRVYRFLCNLRSVPYVLFEISPIILGLHMKSSRSIFCLDRSEEYHLILTLYFA